MLHVSLSLSTCTSNYKSNQNELNTNYSRLCWISTCVWGLHRHKDVPTHSDRGPQPSPPATSVNDRNHITLTVLASHCHDDVRQGEIRGERRCLCLFHVFTGETLARLWPARKNLARSGFLFVLGACSCRSSKNQQQGGMFWHLITVADDNLVVVGETTHVLADPARTICKMGFLGPYYRRRW